MMSGEIGGSRSTKAWAMALKNLIADEALHHGEPRAERLDQADGDIHVAIDGKAPVGLVD